MRAQAWADNPDPQPRGIVFRITASDDGYPFTPYWGGLVTLWDPELEVRRPVDGSRDDIAIHPTQEGAFRLLQAIVERHRGETP